ncbi:hypothetical protein GCM10022243_37570 [Saccharothrix violaceirubra]|uniref:Uncharacterized protein n=1 Tax=Saccharothrix violaceirubra TaxID=413306 RepID=A0A7W7T4A8_9PSEU|nr:hypothetical protein [Saccharothrix violaceirubra]MBB4966329.1 hypothetical protein [Saccharothrix violaceirubra]
MGREVSGFEFAEGDVEIARAVVDARYPRESEIFDDTLDDFVLDPERTVRGVRLGAPVGIGIDLVSVTPYVLSAVGFLGGMVAEKVVEDAYGAVRDRVRRAIVRRREGRAPEAVDAAEAEQVRVLVVVHLVGQGAEQTVAEDVARHVVVEALGHDIGTAG